MSFACLSTSSSYIGVIVGDLNARTTDRPDYINDENYINNHVPIQNNDICNDTLPTKRVSKDSVVNENGSSLLEFSKQTGYMLLNGRIGTDKIIGKYTCVKRAGSSVVDYVMCRNCDLKYISDFEISPPTIYSDNSQVLFNMKFNCKIYDQTI